VKVPACWGSRSAVTIKNIECSIIDRGWDEGWVAAEPPRCALEEGGRGWFGAGGTLRGRATEPGGPLGDRVERADRVGGLLMYGIPNMKLDKEIVQRRVDLMAKEGVNFRDQHGGWERIMRRTSC